MVFNDTTNKKGLIQDCEDLLGMEDGAISGDTNLLKRFTRMINNWYRTVNAWIWEASGEWEYDDSNYTDLPIATTNLVDGQQDYTLPTWAQKVIRVEVKDNEGNWHQLQAIDQSQIDEALEEFEETPGLPKYYDLIGPTIFLYPKPSEDYVTLEGGLKIYVSRSIDEFDYDDTTKEPGFNKDFHQILSLGACLDYAIGFGLIDKVRIFQERIAILKDALQKYYGRRHRDLKVKLFPSTESYI